MTDFTKNDFISKNRKTGVFYGASKLRRSNITIQLSPNYQIESLPKSVKFTNEDKTISFTRRINIQENILTIQLEISINKTLYLLEEYEVLHEFWNILFEHLNENIIIKTN